MDNNLFANLQRDWLAQSHSKEAERVFDELRKREPAIASTSAVDLSALFALLDRRNGALPEDHWLVIAALIRQLDESPLLSCGLLVAVIPMMVSLAARFRWGEEGPWADREEFTCDLVTTTWDVITSLGGTTLAYPLNTIKRRVSGRLVRFRDRALRTRRREVPALFDLVDYEQPKRMARSTRPARGFSEEFPLPVLDLLARVLCSTPADVLDPELVRLIYAHRVLGYPMRELAVLFGKGEDQLEYQARCAEVLLCAS